MPHPRPSADELHAFLAGELVGEDAERIEAFLESDPAALEALEQTAGAAEFSASLCRAAALEPAADEQHLTGVIEKLKAGDFSPLSVEEQARRVLDVPIGEDGSPGRLGKFEILELIAAGGMGLVFKAHDPDLHREVAIKTLSSRLAVDDEARGRFLREARAVAVLDHPHILRIHAVEEGEHVPFIVMPLLGRTLEDLVAEEGPLPPRRAAVLFEQAARALAEAHGKGIVHRDIKPANLLLDEDGERVFVADFGIAQREEEDTLGLGTPAFAAPEQIAGKEVTPRSDLYALDDSGNSAASASTSTNYAQKDGFAGQLTDPAALALSAASDPVDEESTVQLTADLVLDDDTIEADVTPAWSVVAGPLTGIDLAGLASTGAVYQNTTATAGASYHGLNAQLDFLVADADPDNFQTYAADGLPDWWQVTQFGIDNPDAAPALDPDGDEQDNTYEYLAGFLPTDATSLLTTTLLSEDTVELSAVIPARTYRLYRSFDLDIWKPTGATLMPAAKLFDQPITDPAPPGDERTFYKVEIED